MSVLQLKDAHYGYLDGYGKIRWRHDKIDYIDWATCRDVFLGASARCKSFLFWHGRTFGHNQKTIQTRIIRLIERVEDAIKLKAKDRLKFEPTSNKNVVLVVMSPFWRARHCRSLLSALLRVGKYYNRNLNSALDEEWVLSGTKDAVKRFMAGHTHFTGKYFTGWYDEFSIGNEEKLVKRRKSASRKRKKICP